MAVVGQQGGFTELAMNARAGGIGDGHPALLDLDVRHAIAHAIDRETLFDRVVLGLGEEGSDGLGVGRSDVAARDPRGHAVDYDPDGANQLLDEGGYVDTDGDGIREMPGGGRDARLPLRRALRVGATSRRSREFVTGFLDDIGIATDGRGVRRHPAHRRHRRRRVRPVLVGLDAVRRSRPDAVVLHVRPGHHRHRDDRLQRRQLVRRGVRRALRPSRRSSSTASAGSEIVHEMLRLFYDEAPYVVLFEDADLQAYRTDRFEGWLAAAGRDRAGPVHQHVPDVHRT